MRTELLESLPQDLITHVTAICGSRGERWFEKLPALIGQIEANWDVQVGEPFPGIEYNFVAAATTRDGTPVVVKIAPPFEVTEIHGEAKFLRTFNGHAAVRLLEEDRELKALLIERALPGKSLVDLFSGDPLGSIAPAIELLRATYTDPPDDLTDVPSLDEWFAKFQAGYPGTEFPSDVAQKAVALYRQLTIDQKERRYIHGDFHLGNVVDCASRGYALIDPKGIVGHTGYDVAVFLINFFRWQRETNVQAKELLDRAIELFAAGLEMPESSIRQWGLVHAVVGAWWNFEDMPELYDPELAMPDIWDV